MKTGLLVLSCMAAIAPMASAKDVNPGDAVGGVSKGIVGVLHPALGIDTFGIHGPLPPELDSILNPHKNEARAQPTPDAAEGTEQPPEEPSTLLGIARLLTKAMGMNILPSPPPMVLEGSRSPPKIKARAQPTPGDAPSGLDVLKFFSDVASMAILPTPVPKMVADIYSKIGPRRLSARNEVPAGHGILEFLSDMAAWGALPTPVPKLVTDFYKKRGPRGLPATNASNETVQAAKNPSLIAILDLDPDATLSRKDGDGPKAVRCFTSKDWDRQHSRQFAPETGCSE